MDQRPANQELINKLNEAVELNIIKRITKNAIIRKMNNLEEPKIRQYINKLNFMIKNNENRPTTKNKTMREIDRLTNIKMRKYDLLTDEINEILKKKSTKPFEIIINKNDSKKNKNIEMRGDEELLYKALVDAIKPYVGRGRKNGNLVIKEQFYDDNNNIIDEDTKAIAINNKKINRKSKIATPRDIISQYLFKYNSQAIYNYLKVFKDDEDVEYVKYSITFETELNDKQMDKIKEYTQKQHQIYRDNEAQTCVYDGFVKYFEINKDKNAKYKTMYNRLIKNSDKYKKEYTDETLTEIAQLCNSTISIHNLIENKTKEFNSSVMNRYNIKFINTKYNHLDLFTCLSDTTRVEVLDNNEYKQKKKDVDFYIEKNQKLYTKEMIYTKKQSEFNVIFNEWKNKNNYNSLYIDENSIFQEYITLIDFPVHIKFNDIDKLTLADEKDYIEIDLKKAYYNYSNKEINKYYAGLPSGSFISVSFDNSIVEQKKDFLKMFKSKMIGWFRVKFNKIDEKYKKLFNKYFGFYENETHVLFSAEIKMLYDNFNIELEFIDGIYSPAVHIPFNEKFLNNDDKVKHYCKAYGMFFKSNTDDITIVKPLSQDMDGYINFMCEGSSNILRNDGCIQIERKKSKSKSWIHLAYGINGYIRALMMEKMKDVEGDIIGLKLDSLVVKKENSEIPKIINDNRFVIKDAHFIKLFSNFEDTETIHNCKEDEFFIFSDDADERVVYKFDKSPIGQTITNKTIFLGGAGGTGKTHSIINSNCFDKNMLVYTSTSWDLIVNKSTDANIMGFSIPKLTGKLVQLNKSTKKINTDKIRYIIIDEATMIHIDAYTLIRKLYPYALIFIMGDVDEDGFRYQCSVYNDFISPKLLRGCQYVKYTKNYRFDEQLNERLNKMRIYMKKNPNNIYNYIKKEWSDRIFKKDEVVYDDKTIGVSALNDGKREFDLTNYYLNKGAKPKYYVNNTSPTLKYKKGEVYNEKPDDKPTEIRLFNSIHSYQGRQLNDDEKIIICVNSNFDYALYYTALSRAKRVEQIHIIFE